MTNEARMAELRSPRALVCHQQHRADCGVGLVLFVVLADGYLIDCDDEPDVYRVGKKRAGRLLDGREHSEFPA